MSATEFIVSLTPEEAENVLQQSIVEGSITGEVIDRHLIDGENGTRCIILVFEKHYYRAGNRLTLTVCIDNMQGRTRVHAVGGGGGEGLMGFDWGASESFEGEADNALAKYKI